MPSSSSLRAMSSLSSTEKETDSPCVPSRRVVSKVKIFITGAPLLNVVRSLNGRGRKRSRDRQGTALWDSRFFSLLQERHHLAQLTPHRFDRLIGGGLAHGEELLASRFVFVDPCASEIAG